MILLDTFEIVLPRQMRSIELYRGDLTDLRPDEFVDIMILSAFPNDYSTTYASLIGQLSLKGVWVEELARKKAVDLRATSSCWVSEPIGARRPGIEFDRVLCFESGNRRGSSPELVGDIFRCLAPLVGPDAMGTTVAMPLVCCGEQGIPVEQMLSPLMEAAFQWMTHGLALNRLKIVVYSKTDAAEAAVVFSRLKAHYQPAPELSVSTPSPEYDVFISYSHKDWDFVDVFVDELKNRRKDLNFFLDRKDIDPGASWQQKIYESLESCRRVIAMLSPAYLASKRCQEEYNMAHCRHVDSGERILWPVFVSDAKLPLYMRMLEHIDCREGDIERLRGSITNSWP